MTKNRPIRQWKQAAFYHLLVWAVFISYELLCLFTTVGLDGQYLHYGIYYVMYISLFYLNAHVILDFSFFKTKSPYLIAAGLIVVEMIVFGLLKAVIDGLLAGADAPWLSLKVFTRAYLLSNIFRQIFFIGFSIAYWSMLYLTRFRDQAQQMEIERLRQQASMLELENRYISVENAYLQHQVSPHLLFNSLNFIYYAVYKLSDRAGKGIMLLSNLLRYSLTAGSAQQKTIELKQEVEQIRNLIGLDRMRFNEKRYLGFKSNGELSGRFILPLALLTLVENVIKHGECGDPSAPATAELQLRGNKLHFSTVNKKREKTAYSTTGLGLNNLRKRLQNAYPDRFELQVNDEQDQFAVHLSIDL
ncbi:sensor histidine kinase [Mucilaginibacter limnophilus]|nr:histidine kinase [Mucilaginibacter limnophilus]